MSMLEQVVRLDMKPQKNPPHVDCTQYDSGSDGWLIRAYLFNNGSKFVIPTGYTAKIEGTTKENTGFTFAATNIDNANGVVTFALTEDATAFKGSTWCKIVFEKGTSRIATSGFWLDNDRAGVEAETVIGASGFEEQIQDAVDNYLDEHPVSGEGWTDEIKQALLACFRGVAWLNDNDFSDKYTALENALYPDTPTPPPSYLTGYTIVGNPTIDSQYRMTTSDGNFIKTPFNFDNSGKSWELRGKVNVSDANQPAKDLGFYDIANLVDANNDSTRGLLIELNRDPGYAGKFNIFASNTPSSWNIVNPDRSSFVITSLINGDFYFKAGWTGSAYYIAASADGVTWRNELRHEWQSATPIMTGYPIAFGNKRNLAWGYCIYVNSLELDIGGSLYWKAVE